MSSVADKACMKRPAFATVKTWTVAECEAGIDELRRSYEHGTFAEFDNIPLMRKPRAMRVRLALMYEVSEPLMPIVPPLSSSYNTGDEASDEEPVNQSDKGKEDDEGLADNGSKKRDADAAKLTTYADRFVHLQAWPIESSDPASIGARDAEGSRLVGG